MARRWQPERSIFVCHHTLAGDQVDAFTDHLFFVGTRLYLHSESELGGLMRRFAFFVEIQKARYRRCLVK